MKKRNFLSCLLIIAIVLATISPTVLFAAEDIAQDEQVYDETYTEETEEYVEETPEAYDWTIETNELKKWPLWGFPQRPLFVQRKVLLPR